eukprot:gene38300-46543_t
MQKSRSGTQTMNPKRRKWTEGKAGGVKPQCPQGMNCPYRDEYQHQQEFAHSAMAKAPTSHEASYSATSKFSGGGIRLGGNSSSSSLLANVQSSTVLPASKKLKGATLSPSPVQGGDTGRIQCHICMEMIDILNIDSHVLKHLPPSPRRPQVSSHSSSSRPASKQDATKDLRREQDDAYEASILEEVLVASKQEQEKDEVARAIASLPPPPPPGQGVRIKFVLPSGQRVVRAFSPSSPITHLFFFLLAEGHILPQGGGSYELRGGVKGDGICLKRKQRGSLEEAGVRGDCSLILYPVDEDVESAEPEHKTTTSNVAKKENTEKELKDETPGRNSHHKGKSVVDLLSPPPLPPQVRVGAKRGRGEVIDLTFS